jgi:hypothetical protein
MKARASWKRVTVDDTNLLDQLLILLADTGVDYCVVGGQAVNAYVEPVVSLDLDLVVSLREVERIEPLLRQRFKVERVPHSLNVSLAGSDLRVQIQLDPRITRSFPTRRRKMSWTSRYLWPGSMTCCKGRSGPLRIPLVLAASARMTWRTSRGWSRATPICAGRCPSIFRTG